MHTSNQISATMFFENIMRNNYDRNYVHGLLARRLADLIKSKLMETEVEEEVIKGDDPLDGTITVKRSLYVFTPKELNELISNIYWSARHNQPITII